MHNAILPLICLSIDIMIHEIGNRVGRMIEIKIYLMKKLGGYLTYMYVFLERTYENITLSFLWNRSLVYKIWALSERQLSSIVRKRAQVIYFQGP